MIEAYLALPEYRSKYGTCAIFSLFILESVVQAFDTYAHVGEPLIVIGIVPPRLRGLRSAGRRKRRLARPQAAVAARALAAVAWLRTPPKLCLLRPSQKRSRAMAAASSG